MGRAPTERVLHTESRQCMIRLWGSSLAHAVPTCFYGETWVEEDEHTRAGLWPLKAMCLWQVAKCVAIGRGRPRPLCCQVTGAHAGSWHPELCLLRLTLISLREVLRHSHLGYDPPTPAPV